MPPRRSKRQRRRKQQLLPLAEAPSLNSLPAELWVCVALAVDVRTLGAFKTVSKAARTAVEARAREQLKMGKSPIALQLQQQAEEVDRCSLAYQTTCQEADAFGRFPPIPANRVYPKPDPLLAFTLVGALDKYHDLLHELAVSVGWDAYYGPLVTAHTLWLTAMVVERTMNFYEWQKVLKSVVLFEDSSPWMNQVCPPYTALFKWAKAQVDHDLIDAWLPEVVYRGSTVLRFETLNIQAYTSLQLRAFLESHAESHPDVHHFRDCKNGEASGPGRARFKAGWRHYRKLYRPNFGGKKK